MRIPSGIINLGGSKKACLSIAILIVTAIALFLGKMNGSEFVAAATVIAGIYNFSTAYTEGKTIQSNSDTEVSAENKDTSENKTHEGTE